jgi:solute carrier family 25 protein 38
VLGTQLQVNGAVSLSLLFRTRGLTCHTSQTGGLGAVLATLVTAPFDTLKTKQQVFPDRYTSMVQGARLIVRTTGFRGFFDGVSLRVARKAASSAIAWSLYEGLLRRWSR